MFTVHELLKASGGKLIGSGAGIKVSGVSIDSRSIGPGQAFLAIKGNNFDGHDFISEAIRKGAVAVIIQSQKSPIGFAEGKQVKSQKGVSFIAVKDTVRALGDIARYHRKRFNIPVIAVTGSNGKTTTKEMISCVLSKKFNLLKNEGTQNNHIGLPMALLKLNASCDIAVLEIGTNHPGEVEYLSRICLPNIGLITNIGPAHLEYFGSLKNVFREKYALIENLIHPYLGVLNADDLFLRQKLSRNGKQPFLIGFGIANKGDFSASGIRLGRKRIRFLLGKQKAALNTAGSCNIYNALAAASIGRIFGLTYKAVSGALADFDFPRGRLKFIRARNVDFIDDTYNSNPLSLRQALDTLAALEAKGRKIFVMGDMLELGRGQELFHAQAGPLLKDACDIFVAVGGLCLATARAAQKSGFNFKNIFSCSSSREARDILMHKISPCSGDIVLVKGSRSMKMEEVFKI